MISRLLGFVFIFLACAFWQVPAQEAILLGIAAVLIIGDGK